MELDAIVSLGWLAGWFVGGRAVIDAQVLPDLIGLFITGAVKLRGQPLVYRTHRLYI